MNPRSLAQAFWKKLRTSQDPEGLVTNLFTWLKERQLSHQIPVIARHLELQAEREAVADTLRLSLSHEAAPTQLQEISQYVGSANKSRAEVKIDPSLIGGFRAEYRYRIYDGSVKKYLAQLRQAIES